MAVIYSTPLKNTRLQAVVTAIGNNGLLVIGTAALNGATGVLATIPLAATAGTVTGGVLTFSGVPRTANATGTGIAALAELRTSAGVVVCSGLTVDTTAANIILNAIEVSAGQLVQMTAGTITHG